jgi:hypothetical protein
VKNSASSNRDHKNVYKKMVCPKCGIRYLKKEIPAMHLYICMFCRNVAKEEVNLEKERVTDDGRHREI